jgi:hypothetical protein
VRLKALLIVTAIVSSLLGAVMAYLVLTVPNDLKSGALLKQARSEMSKGNNDGARKTLTTLIQQYPRTDAAAAATVALVSIVDSQQAKLSGEVARLRSEQQKSVQAVNSLGSRVTQLASKPEPEPPPVVKAAPAPKKGTITVGKKKPTPKKRTTTRRRRR